MALAVKSTTSTVCENHFSEEGREAKCVERLKQSELQFMTATLSVPLEQSKLEDKSVPLEQSKLDDRHTVRAFGTE